MTKQVYDLEERTFHFAKRVRLYTRKLQEFLSLINISTGVNISL